MATVDGQQRVFSTDSATTTTFSWVASAIDAHREAMALGEGDDIYALTTQVNKYFVSVFQGIYYEEKGTAAVVDTTMDDMMRLLARLPAHEQTQSKMFHGKIVASLSKQG